MSIIERSASPQAPAPGSKPRGGRLRVITAGSVGNMEARLGTSGFDVVAVAETEEALIDAVSADEADAIVVEADLCDSLERVRDLAPNALLIVIGDHTPAGALGRIEPGVSGTVMAGLLHALVAEGVGGAVGWGLVPALGPRGALQVPQRISGWLLSAKGDLVREYVANAFRDHAELLTAASTVAVTVSASLVLTLGAARSHERPHERSERVQVPASAVERAPQVPAGGVYHTMPSPAYVPSQNEGEHGGQRGLNRGAPGAGGRPVGQDADDMGQIENAGDDLGQIENAGDDLGQIETAANDLGQGENASDDHGQGENASDDHGKDENAGDDHGNSGADHGQDENAGDDHGKNENAGDDHGKNENAGDEHGQGENAGDEHGKGGDNQDGDESGGVDQDGNDQDGNEQDGDEPDGDDQGVAGDTATAAETSALSAATGVALT
jgi:hypothetical protein